jgi:ribosomal protein S6--L-glutamate ligase
MKIGILSYTWAGWTKSLRSRSLPKNEKLLVAAAKSRGHEVKVFHSDRCQLVYKDSKMRVLYAGRKFPTVDVMITRPNIVTNVDLELTLNKQLLFMGVKLVNGYMPILRSKNKVRMLQVLGHKGINVPATVVLKRLEYMDDAVKRVGGYPVIVKTPNGSLGKGVVIIESRRSLLSSLDIFWANARNRNLLIQEYVSESSGRDIRAFVVNGKVVASMQRESVSGDFRSNIGMGGAGSPIELTEEEVKMSIDATEAFHLEVSGVDILRTNHGPVIMEVNSNPGLDGITEATGHDVAGEIIDFAVEKANHTMTQQEFRHGVKAFEKELLRMEEPFAMI